MRSQWTTPPSKLTPPLLLTLLRIPNHKKLLSIPKPSQMSKLRNTRTSDLTQWINDPKRDFLHQRSFHQSCPRIC